MERTLSESSIVSVSAGKVATDLGGEIVILDLGAGRYYGLDDVGAHVWKMIQQPVSIGSVCEGVLQTYGVERERCMKDLLVLFEQLMGKGLVELVDEAAG